METAIACIESVLTYLIGPPPTQRPLPKSTAPPTTTIHGIPIPAEASTAPEDTQTWYCDFWQKACAVLHKDRKSIIIYEPKDVSHIPDSRARPEWASKRLRKAYQVLGNGQHPRIVRCTKYLESEAGNGVVVERLTPGPHWGSVPVMTVPVPETVSASREDRIMLALYYRWALQALSALEYFHSRSVYLTFFSKGNVWLRSDFSLAVTGFISVDGPELHADMMRDAWKETKRDERHEGRELERGDEESDDGNEEIPENFTFPWSDGEWAGDGSLFYYDYFDATFPREGGYHQEPLFYWARFVWELMTNGLTAESPLEQRLEWSPSDEAADLRDQLQVLEEARLGSILLKAWKGEYESAEQVAEDIMKTAEQVGISIVRSTVEQDDDWVQLFKDEVDIGEPWEDVFELDGAQEKWGAQTLRFKRKATHANLPAEERKAPAGP